MQSQTLWVAFYVLVALLIAAVLIRALRRLFGRRPAPPLRGAAPGGPASAREAYAAARAGDHVIGWKLDPADRERLLARFPPAYGNVVADHVTLKAQVAADAELPPETHGAVVGRSDDLKGVEALVVRLVDTTERPDGSTYHLTWSLAPGRRAQESNDVIAAQGWRPVDPPVPIRLEPRRFP